MSKSGKNVDFAAALENSFARWDFIHEHGCSDPFWADGVNMNLVRNHIMYYKQQLSEKATLFLLPKAYYREVPPEVDNNYMARPDEIRQNAARSMQIIDADENLKFVQQQSVHLTEKQLKQLCVPAILGYAENLRRAISEDDLLTMRRYENPNGYLESFQSAAQKAVRRKSLPEWSQFRLMRTRNTRSLTNAIVHQMSKSKLIPHRRFRKIMFSLRCSERSFLWHLK